MRDSNPPVQPDIVTYSTIVKAWADFLQVAGFAKFRV